LESEFTQATPGVSVPDHSVKELRVVAVQRFSDPNCPGYNSKTNVLHKGQNLPAGMGAPEHKENAFKDKTLNFSFFALPPEKNSQETH